MSIFIQIYERDVCAYTDSNTSSDLPPYISVILQVKMTATETIKYGVTVSGIEMEHDGKDSIVIVIYKSRNECGMFFTMLHKYTAYIHVVSSLPSLESAEPLPTESSNEGKNYQTNIIMHYNALQSF